MFLPRKSHGQRSVAGYSPWCHQESDKTEWLNHHHSPYLIYLRILPWRRQWHPAPVLLPGISHGWRSLVGCSPWGAKSRARLSGFTFTFHFHALEKEMATHSSVLAWRIPGTGEPGGLLSMGLHRVGHDWSDAAAAAAAAAESFHVCTHISQPRWILLKRPMGKTSLDMTPLWPPRSLFCVCMAGKVSWLWEQEICHLCRVQPPPLIALLFLSWSFGQ